MYRDTPEENYEEGHPFDSLQHTVEEVLLLLAMEQVVVRDWSLKDLSVCVFAKDW
jgi:hypothetical protein